MKNCRQLDGHLAIVNTSLVKAAISKARGSKKRQVFSVKKERVYLAPSLER